MYKIEIEKVDGLVYDYNQGLLFDDVEDAELRTEFMHRMKSGGGEYASFRVIEVATGEVYSEMECD